jgi:cell division GTPase FtsZ
MPKMKKTVILSLIFLLSCGPRLPPTKHITVNGDSIAIDYGWHHFAGKLEIPHRQQWLVNFAQADHVMSEASFALIPLKKADELKATYGDFLGCKSPGASAGKASIQSIFLFSENVAVEDQINEVIKRKWNSPVIEMVAAKVNLTEATAEKGMPLSMGDDIRENIYFVYNIKVARERYN